MSDSVAEYVEKRAELLAHLVLTRRKDVRVFKFQESEDAGLDLVARLLTPVGDGEIYPTFGIQVMGTDEPLANERVATKYAMNRWRHRASKGNFLFPIVVLLFSMEGDQGYFSWVMQPDVTNEASPTLTRVSLDMTRITKASIDEMVEDVVHWFQATAELLLKHVQAK
jgi:hypothetical protein